MIYVKIHKGSSNIVAICDGELIGKKFREGKLCLNVSEHFYKGEKKSIEEIEKMMTIADNLSIVGKKSIKIALDLKVINKDSIIVIEGVLHAQAVSR